MPARVPAEAFADRLAAVRERIADAGVDAGAWFGATSIEYLTGFDHVQTERPVVLAVTDDAVEVTVPRLEVERARANPRLDAVHHYFDYPQGAPAETAVEMLRGLGADAVAADMDGAPRTMGYEGPALSAFLDVERQDWVGEMRRTKSDVEVALLRESATWANLGHRYLADYAEVGAHPATVSQRASMDASRAMLDALGDRYVPRERGDGPVSAGFVSGEQTRLPHAHTANRRLEAGDVLITGATANVDGYGAELERTMFVGEPTDEQCHYFELMLEAQSIAIEALGPGVEIAAVDERVHSYFAEQGVTDLAQHHVGHNVGLGAHEPPYVDRGWKGEMEPGHVYTVEPGLYTDEYGYRHSDTVAVTDDGTEVLTHFPRDLDANVIR